MLSELRAEWGAARGRGCLAGTGTSGPGCDVRSLSPRPSRGLTRLPGSRELGASGAPQSRQVFQGDLAGNPKAPCAGFSKLCRMAAHRSCPRQSVPPGWAQAEDQRPDPPRFLARSPKEGGLPGQCSRASDRPSRLFQALSFPSDPLLPAGIK